MTKRLTSDDYHALAAAHGLQWLGPEVSSNRQVTRWLCPNGHVWETRYSEVQRGAQCRTCSYIERGLKKRITPEQYERVAKRRGFKLVGPIPDSVVENTTWECSHGHRWQAAYHGVRKGNGCPYCAGLARKTAGDYADLAKRRGFIWLGPMPQNVSGLTRWQCPHGHTWQARYGNVSARNTGCPTCKSIQGRLRRQHKERHYHALAKKRGFTWLGPLPDNTHGLTEWQCPEGHIWKAAYSNIYNGTNCPHCQLRVNGQKVSRPQVAIHEMIGGELNYPLARYRIDVAFPDERIAVEYDGWFWHSEARDARRDRYLFRHGWKVLRIKSGLMVPSPEELGVALATLRDGERYAEIVLDDWIDVS